MKLNQSKSGVGRYSWLQLHLCSAGGLMQHFSCSTESPKGEKRNLLERLLIGSRGKL